MGKISSKAKKLRLNAARFLKIIPERTKKIESADANNVKALNDYRPNSIASLIHPEKQYVIVSEVIKISESAKLFKLIPDKDMGTTRLAPFKAGSCISVEVVIGGQKYLRPYSVSSSPLEGYYEIIVKKTQGGTVSAYLNDTVKVGDELTVSGPFGEFTYNPLRDAKTVIGIAGGVGITPFRSYLKAIADGAEDFNMILLYGIQSTGDIVLKDELDKLALHDNIKIVYVMSGDGNAPDGFEKGYITAELIQKYAPEGDYSVFACGPDVMYRHLDGELKKLNLRRKFIRFDYRGEPQNPEAEADYFPAADKTYSILVRERGVVSKITCAANETILKALEKAGIYVPSRCMSGACGYCRTKLIAGEYYMPNNRDGRREADRMFGYIHPCSTFPRSDMEIMLP